MNVKIYPKTLLGKITAPSSKSYAQRYILAALLSNDETEILFDKGCDDITAMLNVAKSLGAAVNQTPCGVIITPPSSPVQNAVLDVGESFTALNLIIPVLSALNVNAKIDGNGSAKIRKIFYDDLVLNNTLPLSVTGKLTGGKILLDGSKTSQTVSGLLFALPLLETNSEIIFSSPVVSKPYVDITIDVLKTFGVKVLTTEQGYFIKGGQTFVTPKRVTVEGDYTSASIFYAANVIGNVVKVTGLNPDSVQGDKRFNEIALKFKSSGTEIDVTDNPDLFPYLSVIAAYSCSETTFKGVGRLKNKECDRVKAIYECLTSLNVDCEIANDRFIVRGNSRVCGGTVNSYGDHRIVTAAAILATKASSPVIIENADCVSKSYPDFFKDFSSAGGKYEIL